MFKVLLCIMLTVAITQSRPQAPKQDEAPAPYQFEYKVDDEETNNHFGQNEEGDQSGKVTGKYYVLLPDGRTMTVEYSAEGETGFVPKISFS